MKKPNLFIIGAPKCGTTSISEYLSTHPSIFLGYVKEPNYWSSDMPYHAKREGFDNLQKYLAMYQSAREDTLYRVDASTHYLYSSVAVSEIEKKFPNSNYIVCLRPQYELALAWHMQMCRAGYETTINFEEAWKLRIARREGQNIPDECPDPKLLDYESIACVGEQIRRLFSTVDRNRIHFIFLEDMKTDVANVYARCLDFLKLEHDGKNEFPISNGSFVNRSNFASRIVRKPLFRKSVYRCAKLMNPTLYRWLKANFKKMLYKNATREPLREEIIANLKKTFRKDDECVAKMLGRSLYSGQ